MKFKFGDMVTTKENLTGVIVKCNKDYYQVYVEEYENIVDYEEKELERIQTNEL